MKQRTNINKFHFLVIDSKNPMGKTSFACDKSKGYVYCDQHFNFCPLCGDSLSGER